MPDVVLTPLTIACAWNVQGRAVAAMAASPLAIELPQAANTMRLADDRAALWLGPESWLVASGSTSLGDFASTRAALQVAGGALFDVTAGRVAFGVRGGKAATVLASGCPLDLDPAVFLAGHCAQSVFGRVGALYCRPRDDTAFVIMVARSFGRDVWHGLRTAALEYEHEIAAPSPF